MTRNPNRLLDQLDDLKNRFGSAQPTALESVLSRLARQRFKDAEALIRFHELLLFVRAYPQNAKLKLAAEALLNSFAKRVEALRNDDVDLTPLESPDVSGIAGTSVSDTFTYPIVRWLAKRHPARLKLDWEWFEDENRLSETWPRFMPLLEEDAFVEANVPYAKWLMAARARSTNDVAWLVRQFESLKRSDREKAELFDSQQLYVAWSPPYQATRTGMRLPVPASKIFYHREPLIQRREVSFRDELAKPAPALEKLSTKQGERALDLAREASTIRYRELYGFTHGDPARVFKSHLGRGVDLFITCLPPATRLPLRAYHAAMIFKNGVAVGYFEGLSLFERMESGFNLYYTFRDGETAWLYARTLNVFLKMLGVTAFAIDPYQVGYENEEGIESGAYWFYRKLGFRPTNPEILDRTLHEEKKIVSRSGYRTTARTLRKLAAGSMIFELDAKNSGDWDRFQVRNVGLAVQRRMAAVFDGDAEQFRAEAVKKLARVLEMKVGDLPPKKHAAFADFAVTLSMLDDLNQWSSDEKRDLLQVIRAKAETDESRYLKLMQKHSRLRKALIRLGS
ncbi:MAG TPA: hypothetical protein VNO50_03410 [Pyrinomonadaceae bacterium]|nr:hypothetical protein [Pyrinomonadaceae bacterium]